MYKMNSNAGSNKCKKRKGEVKKSRIDIQDMTGRKMREGE